MVKMAKKPRKKRASGADFKIQCLTLVSVTFCKITVPMRGYTHYPVGLIDPTCIRSGRVTEGGPPTGKPGGGVDNLRQAGGGGTPSPVTSLLPLHVGSKRPTGYSPAFDTVSLQNITVPSVGHGALDFKSQ